MVDHRERRVGPELGFDRRVGLAIVPRQSNIERRVFGSGDHAAAEASIVLSRNPAFATSSNVRTESMRSIASAFLGIIGNGPMRQGLSRYMLENTSGCFIPIRIVP